MVWLPTFLAALFIALAVMFASVVVLRKRHMGERVMATRIGAGVYGIFFAGFITLVILPIRMAIFNGEASMDDPVILQRYAIAFVALLVLFRTDILGRLPLIGTYIRAYRMAFMRRNVENATKRLNKMEALEQTQSSAGEGE